MTPNQLCPSCADTEHDCTGVTDAGEDCMCAACAETRACWVCGESGPGECACDRFWTERKELRLDI